MSVLDSVIKMRQIDEEQGQSMVDALTKGMTLQQNAQQLKQDVQKTSILADIERQKITADLGSKGLKLGDTGVESLVAGYNPLEAIQQANMRPSDPETLDLKRQIADQNSVAKADAEKARKDARIAKYNAHQDTIEQNAISRLASIRGDTSIKNIENQRDASIQAYNTIARVKQEGRMPSQMEYYDILGQLWKARTGASPTDQALKDLDAKTLHGDMRKAFQYFSGKAEGVTTANVLDNIQNFVADTGTQLDKLHEGYMKPHLIKPTGLDEKRWQPIASQQRGLSFSDATGYKKAGATGTTKAGKPMSIDIAKQIMKKAGNDPAQARAIADRLGYSY